MRSAAPATRNTACQRASAASAPPPPSPLPPALRGTGRPRRASGPADGRETRGPLSARRRLWTPSRASSHASRCARALCQSRCCTPLCPTPRPPSKVPAGPRSAHGARRLRRPKVRWGRRLRPPRAALRGRPRANPVWAHPRATCPLRLRSPPPHAGQPCPAQAVLAPKPCCEILVAHDHLRRDRAANRTACRPARVGRGRWHRPRAARRISSAQEGDSGTS
mmetsp:Transcript_24967/g.63331  ORF Transcript_24967/g.63331 Transcript_24967/m.63331 type:complete len:222 (-) Transcript_24967:170-835(-)